MNLIRVIPLLCFSQRSLIKTQRYSDWKYLGDPINVVKIFNEKKVDEIILLDIDATCKNHAPNIEFIKEFSAEAFMPLSYGGGIRTIDHIASIFNSGLEKVTLGARAIEDVNFVREASLTFGSQSIAVSLDVKKVDSTNYAVFTHRGNKKWSKTPLEYAQILQEAGAGEIILNDINRDGMMCGYNLELINSITQAIEIPLVAATGASVLEDFKKAVEAGASAVAASSFFSLLGPLHAPLPTYPSQKVLEKLFS